MDPDPAVPVLSVRDLKASYGKVQALRGVDLEVRRGELVTLIGSNGAGKTTTLKAILNLVPRDGGEIDYQGTSTDRVPAYLLGRRGIGVVPEGRRIFRAGTANRRRCGDRRPRLRHNDIRRHSANAGLSDGAGDAYGQDHRVHLDLLFARRM
jgi:ABC-type dipeptide/oligopeptide/nickel transport system ATPase component